MRVLFVHQYYGAMGGAETDILLGARALKACGHSVALLYASRSGMAEDSWEETFSQRHALAGETKTEAVGSALRQFVPDVIYYHSLPDLGVLRAMLDAGLPVVRRVHDHRMYCMGGGKYNYFTRQVCRRPASWRCVFPCLGFVGRNQDGLIPFKWVSYQARIKEMELNRRCDALLVYSEYQKEELARNGFDTSKIQVCTPIEEAKIGDSLSSLDDRNLVLFVGQVIRGKGVDLLLRALAKVRAPFEAAIVGDGNHRAGCERLCARLGLANKVRFHGFMDRSQVEKFYAQACLLAVSSVWPEPFGLVGREAMRHGLPVVAFDAGGIREWLLDGENGFLVPWMDTDQFALRIEQLLRNKPLARRLGLRGRELVSQQQENSRQDNPVERLLLQAIERPRNLTQLIHET
jgi:glycosyltransferase involved in cell wall biosynthesis